MDQPTSSAGANDRGACEAGIGDDTRSPAGGNPIRLEPEPSVMSPVAAPFVQAAQVSQMLADLAVLARYVAGRGWVASPLTPAGAVGDSTSGAASAGDVRTELLVLSPEAIARESHLLEQLYRAIEVLTRLAAPATVSTLRLT